MSWGQPLYSDDKQQLWKDILTWYSLYAVVKLRWVFNTQWIREFNKTDIYQKLCLRWKLELKKFSQAQARMIRFQNLIKQIKNLPIHRNKFCIYTCWKMKCFKCAFLSKHSTDNASYIDTDGIIPTPALTLY